LLANGIESNGRILGLVYGGALPAGFQEGQRVFVDSPTLARSVNAGLVRAGLAYVEVYSTMPLALISDLRAMVGQARSDGAGFWPSESLTLAQAIQPRNLADLQPLVMFPKLYRRLVSYFRDGAPTDLTGFDAWIRADPRDRDDRALLPTGEMGNMHDLYAVDANDLRLRFLPEGLMWETDPPRPT
jgi:hypothetical protein